SLAVEYAPCGIRVNTLLPGYVETALIGRYLSNPMIAKALLTQTPLRRFGTPQDIANAALFLASDEAAYITGAALNVDGGMCTTLKDAPAGTILGVGIAVGSIKVSSMISSTTPTKAACSLPPSFFIAA